jgi:hypothetical protein
MLSLGILEGDSTDETFNRVEECLTLLKARFASVGLWKRDFGVRLSKGLPRWWWPIQIPRRRVMAMSRNHLLFRALGEQDWVLWLDVDVIEYPADVIDRLLETEKGIVTPNCVLEYGGPSFDQNAWRGAEKAFLSDLRSEGDLVELDSVGGTMLLIRADLHRSGLIFPPFSYGQANPSRIPADALRIETEGLALMARDMGERCWGMPNLEIRHFPG